MCLSFLRPNDRQNARNHLIHGIIGIWPSAICKAALAIQINGHGIKGTKALFTEEEQQELDKIANNASSMYAQAMKDLEIDPLEAAGLAAKLNNQNALANNLSKKLTQPFERSEEDDARVLAELNALKRQTNEENQKP